MNLINNSSENSNIAAAAYDPGTQTAEVQFKGGATYRYANVPYDIGGQLVETLGKSEDSTGKFFYANMKGKFDFEKV